MVWNFVKQPPLPNFIRRAAQAARYTISGVKPTDWMSPLQPIRPYEPIQDPWQYDRPVGYNLFYTPRGQTPSGAERHTFDELRMVSRQSELVRLAIETRMDQISAVKWQIKPIMEVSDAGEADDDDPRIKELQEFFSKPDKVRDWDQWVRVVLEELFVTDAVSIARRKNRGGGLYSLELVDGSTIFPLIDQDGRQPLPPDPAYQQILKGAPKANYTSDELLYYVHKTQVNTPYGYSPVEQVIESAYTDIERLKYTLAFFTEGSVPDAYITAPDNMSPDRVLTYEAHLNALLAGNRAGRRQMPVLVHGMEMKSLKQAELKNDFDEWLARKICFAFSLPPTAFIKQLNRSTAQSDQERAKEEGLFPVLLYVKRLIDRIIREDFGYDDLEFHWNDDEEKDPKTQAEIDQIYVNAGIMARNEIRDELGLEDVVGGEEPMVTTASGPVPLPGSALDVQMKADAQAQAEQTQAHTLEQISAKTPEQNANDNAANVKKAAKKKLRYDASASASTRHRPSRPRLASARKH
jgi:hypothetical protein